MNKLASSLPYRCAVYFAPPPDSAWGHAGRDWLGRCALSAQAQPQAPIDGIEPALQRSLTAEPRRYGWHATLKAPFTLVPGQDLHALSCWLKLLANRHRAFVLPQMRVQRMGNFLALRPQDDCAPLQTLADDCVTRLHHLAMPLNEAELSRRRRTVLSPRQDALLGKWGYPWVLDEFRFHFSLTGGLTEVCAADSERLLLAAQQHFESLPPCRVDAISLFVEPVRGADFVLHEQIGLVA